MYQLFRAEWIKIAGNRWTTTFLMWIFPAGTALLMIGAILAAILSSEFQESFRLQGIWPWNKTLVNSWVLFNNELGRWIVLAFTGFVFAGEYQNGTWKNLITRRSRTTLILNKFFTLGVFVVTAFVLTTIINAVGAGIVAGILDMDYGLSNAGNVMGDFLRDYGMQMFITFTFTLIAASYTALAAMFTKNVIASVIIGILITVFETGILAFIALVQWLLKVDLLFIYQLTPSFNIWNINSWVFENAPHQPFPELATMSMNVSLVILALWVIGLISLTVTLFRRQDITT